MTPQQQQFLDGLSKQELQAFSQMSESQRASIYRNYLKSNGGGTTEGKTSQPRSNASQTNSLLSYATRKFGKKGLEYVQKNFDLLDSNLESSGASGTLDALSTYLGSGGDFGEALKTGATSFGLNYAGKESGDWIGKFSTQKGQEAFDNILSESGPEAAQVAGASTQNLWGAGLNAGASGALAGVSRYLSTGDAGEGLKTGATETGKSLLTNYTAQYVQSAAYNKAITAGATKAAATAAATKATASFVPVVGGVLSAAISLAQGGSGVDAGKAGMQGAAFAANPIAGTAMTAAMTAIDVKDRNSSSNDRVTVKYNHSTGRYEISTGGGTGNYWESFKGMSTDLQNKIGKELKAESDGYFKRFEQITAGMSPEEKEETYQKLGGDDYFATTTSMSEDDINHYKDPKWDGKLLTRYLADGRVKPSNMTDKQEMMHNASVAYHEQDSYGERDYDPNRKVGSSYININRFITPPKTGTIGKSVKSGRDVTFNVTRSADNAGKKISMPRLNPSRDVKAINPIAMPVLQKDGRKIVFL